MCTREPELGTMGASLEALAKAGDDRKELSAEWKEKEEELTPPGHLAANVDKDDGNGRKVRSSLARVGSNASLEALAMAGADYEDVSVSWEEEGEEQETPPYLLVANLDDGDAGSCGFCSAHACVGTMGPSQVALALAGADCEGMQTDVVQWERREKEQKMPRYLLAGAGRDKDDTGSGCGVSCSCPNDKKLKADLRVWARSVASSIFLRLGERKETGRD